MGSDGGGIQSVGATLDEYWDALEADFQHVYGLDLREELHTAGCRRLLALITQLPPGSAFGRAQGWRDPLDLMHEWALTLIQFQAGKKVKTPPFMREVENGNGAYRAQNADEIRSFLGKAFNEPPTDSGGFVFPG